MSRPYRHRLVSLLLCAALVPIASVASADDAHRQAAEELLQLIQIDRGLAPMAARMRQSTLEQIRAQDIAVGEEPRAAPYLARIGEVIERTLSWERLRDDFIEVYTGTFSHEELRELVRFFSSPVGSRYLANVPTLNRQATEIIRSHAMAASPEVQSITEEMRQALDTN